MNIDRLLAASEVAGELGEAFNNLPESEREAVSASLVLNMANLYLVEMAHHLQEGMEPYDALLATARGEMKLPKSAEVTATLLKLMAAKPNK